jgi:putative endonuclease
MHFGSLLSRLRLAWYRYRSLGACGERVAERYLRGLGYQIVARGARGRLGELDLVAVDARTVVFVEVKTRRSHQKGHPAEAVGPQKQQRLTRLALAYLKRHDLLEHAARFDVLAITWPKSARKPTIEHIKSAFDAVGRGQMYS